MPVSTSSPRPLSSVGVFGTAFVGLFFDYYDLYLFVYLERTLAAAFGLTPAASNVLQFSGLAGVGLGAFIFGYLADRWGRERMLLVVFVVYVVALAGISLAWNFGSLLSFRVLASLALGAEWGISHAWMSERVERQARYRFSALLQFAILGGLLAALGNRFLLPLVGWRWLFAASILPVVLLSVWRWRCLVGSARSPVDAEPRGKPEAGFKSIRLTRIESVAFIRCLALASLTIASGTLNVFFVKELPQSTFYTVLFWANVAPGMLLGALVVRWYGVRRAVVGYAFGLIALSLLAWSGFLPGGKLAFALSLPVLNGIPFGLMGAYFNEVFFRYRTMLSGSAYNVGRILAGFSPFLITGLGLNQGVNYFLFSAFLGIGVCFIGWQMVDDRQLPSAQMSDPKDRAQFLAE